MIARYLTRDDFQILQTMGRLRRYNKGEVIVAPGKWSKKRIYIIQDGLVAIFGQTSTRKQFIHMLYGSGEVFPVTGLNPQYGNPLTQIGAIAETYVTVYEVPYTSFMDFMQADTVRLTALFRQVADQFTIYTYRVDNLQFMHGRERLAYRFLLFASRFGVRQDGYIEIPRVSRKTVASAVNLREEVVSREMARFKRHGIIIYAPRTIRILDMDKLKQEVGKNINLPFQV